MNWAEIMMRYAAKIKARRAKRQERGGLQDESDL